MPCRRLTVSATSAVWLSTVSTMPANLHAILHPLTVFVVANQQSTTYYTHPTKQVTHDMQLLKEAEQNIMNRHRLTERKQQGLNVTKLA